jgi:hypothetical protein
VTSAASAASITPVQGTQRAACGRLLPESGANAVQCAKRLVVERHAFGGPEGKETSPRPLTHLALISAAFNLDRALD